MVIRVDPKTIGVGEVVRLLNSLPQGFRRVRRSALGRTGFYLINQLKEFMKSDFARESPPLHPLTVRFRHRFKKGAAKFSQRRGQHPGPVIFLERFARYRVDKAGTKLQVLFARTGRGDPGSQDPVLLPSVRRIQDGETQIVTPRMRRFFATTRRRRPKRQRPGTEYFPLRAETTRIVTPPRPIFDPFFAKVASRIFPKFKRFVELRLARLEREGR